MWGRLVTRATSIATKVPESIGWRAKIVRLFAATKVPYSDRLRRQKDAIIDGLIDKLQEKKQKRLAQAQEETRFPRLKGQELPTAYYPAKRLAREHPQELETALDLLEDWREANREEQCYMSRPAVVAVVRLARIVAERVKNLQSANLYQQRLAALQARDWDLYVALLYLVERSDLDRKIAALASVLKYLEVPTTRFEISAQELVYDEELEEDAFLKELFALDKEELPVLYQARLNELSSKTSQEQVQNDEFSSKQIYTGKNMEQLRAELEQEAREDSHQEENYQQSILQNLPITQELLQAAHKAVQTAHELLATVPPHLRAEGLPLLKSFSDDLVFSDTNYLLDELLALGANKFTDTSSQRLLEKTFWLSRPELQKPRLFGPLKTRYSRKKSALRMQAQNGPQE